MRPVPHVPHPGYASAVMAPFLDGTEKCNSYSRAWAPNTLRYQGGYTHSDPAKPIINSGTSLYGSYEMEMFFGSH